MPLEDALIEHASPTLAGLKPANLFRYRPEDLRSFALDFKHWREHLAASGLQLVILRGCRKIGGYLMYLYRPRDLHAALTCEENRAFLLRQGYSAEGSDQDYLRQLAGRLCLDAEFPNEIGVFLGYPLEDVEGFIQNKGRNFTCCGYWKVYGDPCTAQRRFDSYRKCTEIYRRIHARGTPVTQLVVAA